jgi:hypothetical protein
VTPATQTRLKRARSELAQSLDELRTSPAAYILQSSAATGLPWLGVSGGRNAVRGAAHDRWTTTATGAG